MKANISAPPQVPHIETGDFRNGISSWVSLPAPAAPPYYWIQAGWLYQPSFDPTGAKKYVEWCVANPDPGDFCANKSYYGYQNWGDTTEYRVVWAGGTIWCGWVDGVQRDCKDIVSAPIYVEALSEVHISPLNELDSTFSNVYYMDSNYNLILFDQALWIEDAPYVVDKITEYEYRNHGP